MEKDTSRPRIHAATTYKLYIIFCICLSSGIVLMFKFPEMHGLAQDVDPLSFKVHGLSIKGWKIAHILSSLGVVLLTVLHMYFNRDWIRKVGSRKLNLSVVIGLILGFVIVALGVLAPGA